MSKNIIVHKDKCIGCLLCTTIASNSLAMGDDGKAEVKIPLGDDKDTIQEAIDSCPVGAIKWQE